MRTDDKIGGLQKAQRALEAPCRADPEHRAQDQTQVVRRGRNQVPLADVHQPTDPRPPRPAGLAGVREAPLHPFAAPPLQPFAPRPLDPAPIAPEGRLPLGRLALPPPPASTRLRDVRADAPAVALGQRLGLDEEQLRVLGQGAMLHDLGKIGLPDDILKKAGELDDVELELIKEHPKLTFDILAPLEKSNHFSDIARSHHERWDGNGYPDGLDGEDIPLLARIVAIADTWDAMTSDRIYRQGMTEEVALAILEREKHLGQWDPYLIDEFIKLIRHEHGFDPFDQTS